jgi:hypothetical protein
MEITKINELYINLWYIVKDFKEYINGKGRRITNIGIRE